MSEESRIPIETKDIVLKITLTTEGKMNLEGPIQDKILSYGMLQSAMELIAEFHKKQNANKVFEGGRLKGMFGIK